jgi:hypothetical protein
VYLFLCGCVTLQVNECAPPPQGQARGRGWRGRSDNFQAAQHNYVPQKAKD